MDTPNTPPVSQGTPQVRPSGKARHIKAAVPALLAALFYAVNIPFSKLMLREVPATMMAAFLYLGAGAGMGILYAFHFKKEDPAARLTKADFPYTVGMIVLDIAAPILLMYGILYGTAANASLLGNFEIVATACIALAVFKEPVGKKLWLAIVLITLSGILLTFREKDAWQFSPGSALVLAATCCWGLENNCTGKISQKSTYEIVTLKGIFSGLGSLLVAFLLGEQLPSIKLIALAMLMGFICYGLSIFMYVRAQRVLGAAKTGAFYAINPFVASFLSFLLVGETPTVGYCVALILMLIGSVLAL